MKIIDAVWVHQSYLLPLYNFYFPANHFPLPVASLQTLEACALSLCHQGASVARWIALRHCEPSDPGQAVPPRRRASLLRCRSSFRCSLLDSPPTFSLHEGQAEVPGALDVAPPSLRLASPGDLGDPRGLRDLGQQLCHDVSTLTGD